MVEAKQTIISIVCTFGLPSTSRCVYDGTATVSAFDGDSILIFYDEYEHTDVYPVSIPWEDGISAVVIGGGNNETWIDDLCMDR